MDKKNISPKYAIYDAGGDTTKRWFIYWYDNGKRIRHYGSINQTNNAAERHTLIAHELSKLRGGWSDTNIANKMLKIIYSDNLRPSTIKAYTGKVRMLDSWLQYHPYTPASMDAFIRTMRVGLVTKNAYRVTLSALAIKAKIPDYFTDIKIKKGKKIPAKLLSLEQIAEIKPTLQQHQLLWLAVQCVYYCYLRPGELRLVKIGDIDLKSGRITIPVENNKSGIQAFRYIPNSFIPVLEPFMAYPKHLYLLGLDAIPGIKPIASTLLGRQMRSFFSEHGYPKGYSLYSWRHTSATNSVMRTKRSIKALQQLMGHASLETTAQYIDRLNSLSGMEVDNVPTI